MHLEALGFPALNHHNLLAALTLAPNIKGLADRRRRNALEALDR
jgi:hypothetical protein